MKHIRVTIEGPINSGKSTVAIAIRDILKAAGFDVSLNDDSPTYFPEKQDERIKLVATTTRIDIHAVQTRRFG